MFSTSPGCGLTFLHHQTCFLILHSYSCLSLLRVTNIEPVCKLMELIRNDSLIIVVCFSHIGHLAPTVAPDFHTGAWFSWLVFHLASGWSSSGLLLVSVNSSSSVLVPCVLSVVCLLVGVLRWPWTRGFCCWFSYKPVYLQNSYWSTFSFRTWVELLA